MTWWQWVLTWLGVAAVAAPIVGMGIRLGATNGRERFRFEGRRAVPDLEVPADHPDPLALVERHVADVLDVPGKQVYAEEVDGVVEVARRGRVVTRGRRGPVE